MPTRKSAKPPPPRIQIVRPAPMIDCLERFAHVSTAYVAGDRVGRVNEHEGDVLVGYARDARWASPRWRAGPSVHAASSGRSRNLRAP